MTVAFVTIVTATVVIGVLENPQCKSDVPRSVRVLFHKKAAAWVSLASPDKAPAKLPSSWTVAFDGRRLGRVTTTDPGWQSIHPWTFPRDRLLEVREQKVPTVANRGERFRGWCGPPATRPLVVVSEPNVSDPDRWRLSEPPAELRARLFPEFEVNAGQAAKCPVDPEKPVEFKYSPADLRFVTGYVDRHGRRLVALRLDLKLNNCDFVPDPVWLPNWYLVSRGRRPDRFMGNSLWLVDAGDYDGDGRSELLFWYSGYDRDGYVLFTDDLSVRVEYLWAYH